MDDDSDVQILEEPPALRVRSDSEEIEYEERKQRRRKIRRAARRAKGYPSFLTLLTMNYNDGDEDSEAKVPDPYLIPSTVKIEPVTSSLAKQTEQPKRLRIDVNAKLGLKEGVAIKVEDSCMIDIHPDTIPSALASHRDEGWYEGVISMAMADDSFYLSPLQTWTRRQFEFFSATVEDASLLQAGRRAVTVGRVGIRCIHCKAARRSVKDPWPIGAMSYPTNVNSLHTICTQKPTLHFEHNCKYMSNVARQELDFIQQQSELSSKRFKSAFSVPLYYILAAKRIGLTDTDDGLRFERDLSLEPLPLETIRQQHQIHQHSTGGDDYDGLDSSTTASPAKVVSSSAATATKINADEASERVLAQAIADLDESNLCTAEQKILVTDFMFLTVRQMKTCNALPSDISSRGKRAKGVHVGLAGYSCRHCADTMECFRSYPSAADNMVSSIMNSFWAHVQKCRHMPQATKRALTEYKRLHTRQLVQLPYGSQRKFMQDLWERIRADDKTEEEMAPIIASLPLEQGLLSPPTKSTDARAAAPIVTASKMENAPNYPIVDDQETQTVLQGAERDWDPAVNDFLIRPEDRSLVSDYVFLAMRQLKAVGPNNPTRSQLYGLSCIHCHDRECQVSPSGRSYPSAPDNYASALNSSYYNHFLNCTYLPTDVKQALVATRKIHSVQCASLQFGSQRKYFNRLFERLQSISSSNIVTECQTMDGFNAHGFVNVSTKQQPYWMCQMCSGIPLAFRAPGSVWFQTPDPLAMQHHQKRCNSSKWDFSHAGNLLQECIEGRCDSNKLFDGPLRKLLLSLLGNDTNLVDTLTKGLESFIINGNGATDAPLAVSKLWPVKLNVSTIQTAFEEFADETQWTGSRHLADQQKLGTFIKFLCPYFEIPPNGRGEERMEVDNVESMDKDPGLHSEVSDNQSGAADDDEENEQFLAKASDEDMAQSGTSQDSDDDQSEMML
ncbi:hypothetical protein FisN_12Hh213 [Fistulifera solaris]|uniref:Uncharacterized protein n=1 Tax=Fistulifera solaris TaxID=1519565 RepID=A0A1Z5KBH0_FISSO|nr:hypothetical protein FisN_12Hh213 [Fistulifera solaris]|eukprot:GAX23640.1 hypothetical protein FisN_12Hh213 [Fistulifera solaris]